MWWEIGWDSWVGLGLGVASILVGIGAWIYAARANTKAGEVETAFQTFRSNLDERLRAEEAQRGTEPVTHDPANFIYRENGRDYWLVNEGPGVAYDVQVVEVAGMVHLTSTSRWRTFDVDQSEKLVLTNQGPWGDDAVLVVTWFEYAEGPKESRQIVIPVAPTP